MARLASATSAAVICSKSRALICSRAEKVSEANGRIHSELLGLLAWLYQQEGRYEKAVAAAVASERAARESGRSRLAAEMQAMAAQYRRQAENARH